MADGSGIDATASATDAGGADSSVLASAGALFRDVFMIAGVVWPYYPQARSILATRNPEGFSLLVSLVIIVACTLRVFFWVVKRFETVLLLQAVAAVAAQVAMLAVVMHVKRANGTAPAARFRDLKAATFWAWGDLRSYLEFMALLVICLWGVTTAAGQSTWYAEALGTAALGIEALLPVPQVLKNFRQRSTAGLSAVLVVSWFVGDVFKTAIAIQLAAPVQFVACGVFQMAMDAVILVQMCILYRGRPAAASDVDPNLGTDDTSEGSAAAAAGGDASVGESTDAAAASAGADAQAAVVHRKLGLHRSVTGSSARSNASAGGDGAEEHVLRGASGAGSGVLNSAAASSDEETDRLLSPASSGRSSSRQRRAHNGGSSRSSEGASASTVLGSGAAAVPVHSPSSASRLQHS